MRNICDGARALRGRGEALDVLLARPDRPRRCTLPITALRVMPPSSAAIWLAERPSDHSFFRSSTRSSVHDMSNFSIQFRVRPKLWPRLAIAPGQLCWPLAESIAKPGGTMPPDTHATDEALDDCPPHDMSYLTRKMLQYGGTPAQESDTPLPHIHADMWMIWVQN